MIAKIREIRAKLKQPILTDTDRQVLADVMMEKISRLIDEKQEVPEEIGRALDKLLPYRCTLGFKLKVTKYGIAKAWKQSK